MAQITDFHAFEARTPFPFAAQFQPDRIPMTKERNLENGSLTLHFVYKRPDLAVFCRNYLQN